MLAEHINLVDAAGEEQHLRNSRLRDAIGYRVDTSDGHLGIIESVPVAGRPPRPLVLIVRREDTIRFVSVRNVRAVIPEASRILLRDATATIGHADDRCPSVPN